MSESDYIDDVFGPAGYLSQQGSDYQARPGQIAMAREVDAAIRNTDQLFVEAGTGTGKSLAYAVPTVYHTMRRGGCAVIVTSNILLQEQLVKKDLPKIARFWPFRFELLKGRSNYLCHDRLYDIGRSNKRTRLDKAGSSEIEKWARITSTGDKSELSFEPSKKLRRNFSVSASECKHAECDYVEECFANRARRRSRSAHVIVTNYHMLFSHLKVKERTGLELVLPSYSIVIMDEAHKAVNIARDFFGWKLSAWSFSWAAEKLGVGGVVERSLSAEVDRFFSSLVVHEQSKAYEGSLKPGAVSWQPLDSAIVGAAAEYEQQLKWILERQAKPKAPVAPVMTAAKVADRLQKLHAMADHPTSNPHEAALAEAEIERIIALIDAQDDPDEEKPAISDVEYLGVTKRLNRLRSLREHLLEAMTSPAPNTVYSIKKEENNDDEDVVPGLVKQSFLLTASPVSMAESLGKSLFSLGQVTIATSATITADGSFSFIAGEFGAVSPKTLVAQSPFSWRDQVLLVTPPCTLPTNDPTNDPRYPAWVAAALVQVIAQAGGRTLGLFTSHANLKLARAAAVKTGYRVLVQGELPRAKLIDEFRRDVQSVLLGTMSFWEGVDVPGESLSCVLIDKLPFTWKDPVDSYLKDSGVRNVFMKRTLPKTVIMFKQGFGRLIRSVTDRGAVIVLDPKVITAGYSSVIIRSLPAVRRSYKISDIEEFLDLPPVPPVSP